MKIEQFLKNKFSQNFFILGCVLLVYPFLHFKPESPYLIFKRSFEAKDDQTVIRMAPRLKSHMPLLSSAISFYEAKSYKRLGQDKKALEVLHSGVSEKDELSLLRTPLLLAWADERGLQQLLNPTDLLDYAFYLQGLTDYGKSIRVIDYIHRYFPNYQNSQMIYLKALNTYFLKDYRNAHLLFEALIPTQFSDAHYYLGKIAAQQRNRTAAAMHWNQILEQVPQDPNAHRALYELIRLNSSSDSLYMKLLKEYPQDANAATWVWKKGYDAFQKQDWEKALYWFDLGLKYRPSSSLADAFGYWSARALLQMQKPVEYKRQLRQLYEHYPFSYYGSLAGKQLKLKVKIPDFVTDTQHYSWLRFPLSFFMENELWEEAEAMTLKDLSNDSSNISAQMALGEIYYKQNKFYESLQALFPLYLKAIYSKESIPKLFWTRYFPRPYAHEIKSASAKVHIHPLWVTALIHQESHFKANVQSHAAASGLMQIIPPTAMQLAREMKLPSSDLQQLYMPEKNIAMGVYYLSTLKKELGQSAFVLAGYNAGPGAVKHWRRISNDADLESWVENIPYTETRWYVKKIMGHYWNYLRLYDFWHRSRVGGWEWN